MGRERTVLYIPGILSDADNNFAWHAAAARATRRLTAGRLSGDSFDYELELIPGIPIRWMPKLKRKVSELVRVLRKDYALDELHVVVHSNGGNMITFALGQMIAEYAARGTAPVRIESLQLIAPSCESHCFKNHLNTAVELGIVGTVWLYQPGADFPVWVGRRMRTLFGWAGLGHGDLSIRGFRAVEPRLQKHFHTHVEPGYRHTTWFKPELLETTLKLVLSNADAAVENTETKP